MDRVLIKKTEADNVTGKAPALSTEQLFDGFREIRLFHGSQEYRLRLTRNDKLILTK
ncbi:MAG TPA: hemin uptake protein HemP [Phycisphaerales bacterium]|nr:hemin uptake protein HemP [Phycisphaerales bacterium]